MTVDTVVADGRPAPSAAIPPGSTADADGDLDTDSGTSRAVELERELTGRSAR